MGKGFLSILTAIAVVITSSSIFAGCSQSSQQAITSSVSETQDKSLETKVADLSSLGLTARHVTKINLNSLPHPFKALAEVRFKDESGSRFKLLRFSTRSRTQAAWHYDAGINQYVHRDGRLSLVSNRSMEREWFEKYQAGSFKQ